MEALLPSDVLFYGLEHIPCADAEKPTACHVLTHAVLYEGRTDADEVDGEFPWEPIVAYQTPEGTWIGVCFVCFCVDEEQKKRMRAERN
jgi:hypothetical protein